MPKTKGIYRCMYSLLQTSRRQTIRANAAPSLPPRTIPQIVEQFEAWAEEFGGDYEIQLVGTRVIVVTGLSDIRRILTLRPSKFKRGMVPVSNCNLPS